MSTTLANCRILLSKEMGDYWASESTTPNPAAKTALTDTQLAAKADDWIDGDREMYDLITDADVNEHEERHITALASGVLTMVTHTANNVAGVSYEIHRLFPASEKRRALIHAAKAMYPHGFTEIRDESMVSGNWLKDGSFEIWTSSSALTNWTTTTSTIAQTTSSPYYKHGATSCKISTAAGTVKQAISNWDDLKRLAGRSITFTIQGWCDTASCLRISINDGATQTYSSYHTGDSAWTQDNPRNDDMYVQQFIDWNPTEITLTIHHEVAAATSYVDDARIIASTIDSPRIYIGNLNLVLNKPHQVLIEPYYYSKQEPWALIHNIRYDQTNGYMYLPSGVSPDYRLRILGNKYLDFYDSSGVVGTDWDDDSIDLDSPQIEILIAQAMIYLCQQRIVPNYTSGEGKEWAQSMAYWQAELRERINRFGMTSQPATVSWR